MKRFGHFAKRIGRFLERFTPAGHCELSPGVEVYVSSNGTSTLTPATLQRILEEHLGRPTPTA